MIADSKFECLDTLLTLINKVRFNRKLEAIQMVQCCKVALRILSEARTRCINDFEIGQIEALTSMPKESLLHSTPVFFETLDSLSFCP